jgi:hypothetical protein
MSRTVAAALLLLAPTGFAYGQVAQPFDPPRPQKHFAPKVEWPWATVSVYCPTPGVLDVRVIFDLDNEMGRLDHYYYPHAQVFRKRGSGWETVWSRDYPERWLYLRPSTYQTPTFREKLDMPRGSYLVRVGLRECELDFDDLNLPYLRPYRFLGVADSCWHVVQ